MRAVVLEQEGSSRLALAATVHSRPRLFFSSSCTQLPIPWYYRSFFVGHLFNLPLVLPAAVTLGNHFLWQVAGTFSPNAALHLAGHDVVSHSSSSPRFFQSAGSLASPKNSRVAVCFFPFLVRISSGVVVLHSRRPSVPAGRAVCTLVYRHLVAQSAYQSHPVSSAARILVSIVQCPLCKTGSIVVFSSNQRRPPSFRPTDRLALTTIGKRHASHIPKPCRRLFALDGATQASPGTGALVPPLHLLLS